MKIIDKLNILIDKIIPISFNTKNVPIDIYESKVKKEFLYNKEKYNDIEIYKKKTNIFKIISSLNDLAFDISRSEKTNVLLINIYIEERMIKEENGNKKKNNYLMIKCVTNEKYNKNLIGIHEEELIKNKINIEKLQKQIENIKKFYLFMYKNKVNIYVLSNLKDIKSTIKSEYIYKYNKMNYKIKLFFILILSLSLFFIIYNKTIKNEENINQISKYDYILKKEIKTIKNLNENLEIIIKKIKTKEIKGINDDNSKKIIKI